SAQSAMSVILDTMVRLLAPILTFTAEEIWGAMPAYEGKEISIHLTQFPEVKTEYIDESLGERWRTMIAVRSEIAKSIETARKNKEIGHSLDAAVLVALPEKLRPVFEGREEDLRALLIVSQLRIVGKDAITNPFESKEIEGLSVGVSKAKGEKCNRCWIYSEHLGINPEHPTICERCVTKI
ncbi:MAG: class I tRNA ligase family protein, partial [Syntrophales bacterium]|nr:class I tRNA ligase family protein [Syntrophales bacterium]